MGLGQSVHRSGNYTSVRLLHNVSGAPNVDVYVDGRKRVGNVSYKDFTDYLRLPSGLHSLVVKAAGAKKSDKALLHKTLPVKRCKYYTLIVSGDVEDLDCTLTVLPILDESKDECENLERDPEMSYLRFVHAAATVGAVDVWSRADDGDVLTFDNFEYKDAAKYLKFNPGDLTLIVSPTGNLDNVLLGPVLLTLEKGKTYSVVATGVVDSVDTPFDAVLLVDRDLYVCL